MAGGVGGGDQRVVIMREVPTAASSGSGKAAFHLVVLYLFLEFGRPQDLIPGLAALHLPGLVTALLGAGLFLTKGVDLRARETRLFMALLVLMAFHVPLAVNNYWALSILLTMVQTLVAYLAITTFVGSYDTFLKLRTLWLAIHVYLALVGIMNQGRGVGGFLEDENDFSMTLNMAIPFAFFPALVETRRMRQLAYAATAALFVYANVLTLSRGGFIGLVAVALYCWFRSPRKLVSGALIGILTLTIVAAAPERYWDEVESIQHGTADPTGKSRKFLWEIGWVMFLDNPIVGVGQGNFPFRFREYEIASGFELGMDGTSRAGRAAHSLYFTLLPELGLAGTTIWSLMLLAVYRNTRSIRHAAPPRRPFDRLQSRASDDPYYLGLAMEASLVGYLVSGVFISVLYYPSFWVLLAFVVGLRNATAAKAKPAFAASPWYLRQDEPLPTLVLQRSRPRGGLS